MSYHRDHPRYVSSLLAGEVDPEVATPFIQKWEAEYRRTRWIERSGAFYPAPGWAPRCVWFPKSKRQSPSYAGRIQLGKGKKP